MNLVSYLFIAGTFIVLASCDDSRPWYETLPAVAMDYKVHIDAGKEDCYFQYVNPGATFFVSFQVNFIYYYFNINLYIYGIFKNSLTDLIFPLPRHEFKYPTICLFLSGERRTIKYLPDAQIKFYYIVINFFL